MMNKLFIDTATKTLIVALYKGEQLIDHVIELANRDHSRRLMPAIEQLVAKNNLTVRDINEIYCSEGPGSYTGVRIGVTVAKTIAWTLNQDLYSISSLKVIASAVPFSEGQVILPVIDARRGNVFAGLYRYSNNCLEIIKEEKLYNFKELLDSVRDNVEIEQAVTIVGQDVHLHEELLSDYNFNIVSEDHYNIVPIQVINLKDFEKVNQIHDFVPNYKRLTEAERNLSKNKD